MTNEEFRKAVLWVIRHYGSDAGERQEPGSKSRSQAERIAQILDEVNEVQAFIDSRGYRTVKVVPWTMEEEGA